MTYENTAARHEAGNAEHEATLVIQDHLTCIVNARRGGPMSPVTVYRSDFNEAIGTLHFLPGLDAGGYQLYILLDRDQPKSWSVIFSVWDVESIGAGYKSITLREV